MKIAVLFGGTSEERDVSIASEAPSAARVEAPSISDLRSIVIAGQHNRLGVPSSGQRARYTE
jgi:D-alanine-D-alanine ligase-like ATP-grasp enzyme